MRDENAQRLLAKVMGWDNQDTVLQYAPPLQLLASYKYDTYQRFGPGKRFVESLALWLDQFEQVDRSAALQFVVDRLVFVSEGELTHLVQHAYTDVIAPERMRLVAQELGIAAYRVADICAQPRFQELQLKSLYLGLSDGSRTNELRRFSGGEIGNEQIWQAYELGEAKAGDMLEALQKSLKLPTASATAESDLLYAIEAGDKTKIGAIVKDFTSSPRGGVPGAPRFTLVWLLDDFSGSGNTYIRYDPHERRFKGKIKKIYERLHQGDLIDTSHYEVFLLLYVATRQAIDHIEYWAERFTSENNFKPLQVKVLTTIEPELALTRNPSTDLHKILSDPKYYDHAAFDEHMAVGGTLTAQLGFAACALPIVLSHNTPNNSVFILWGGDHHSFRGLFPRISRHKEV